MHLKIFILDKNDLIIFLCLFFSAKRMNYALKCEYFMIEYTFISSYNSICLRLIIIYNIRHITLL